MSFITRETSYKNNIMWKTLTLELNATQASNLAAKIKAMMMCSKARVRYKIFFEKNAVQRFSARMKIKNILQKDLFLTMILRDKNVKAAKNENNLIPNDGNNRTIGSAIAHTKK